MGINVDLSVFKPPADFADLAIEVWPSIDEQIRLIRARAEQTRRALIGCSLSDHGWLQAELAGLVAVEHTLKGVKAIT